MKRCPTCCHEKPLDQFYTNRRTPDGRKSQCKACHTASNIRTRDPEKKRDANARHMAAARTADPDKFRTRDREASRTRAKTPKSEARAALNNAVKRGEVVKPIVCEGCGEEKRLTGHHDDYSKYLVVRWLCYSCHGKVHRHVRPLTDPPMVDETGNLHRNHG